MISEFIANYKELGIQGCIVIAGVWVVWYLIRSIMGMFKHELKDLVAIGKENSLANAQIAKIQERTLNSLEKHEQNSLERDVTQLEILKNTLNLSNGGNPVIKKALKDIDNIFEIIRVKRLDK